MLQITNKATWPHFSPLSAHSIVSAWRLVLSLHKLDDWNKASSAWKSQCVLSGVVLKHANETNCILVLHSDAYAAVGVGAKTFCNAGARAKVDLDNVAPQYKHIHDFDSWSVRDVEVVGPNKNY